MDTEDTTNTMTHTELMASARHSLSGRWGLAIGGILLLIVCQSLAGIIPLAVLLIGGPFAIGAAIFALRFAREEEAFIEDIFAGFRQFPSALVAYLLIAIGVSIGLILLIVPGIVMGLGWSQTFFILANNPEMRGTEAMQQSWEMMKGRKTDFFILGLHFIPWALLCLLTLGIGFFFFMPWVQVTMAKYYDSISGREQDLDLVDHLVVDS